MMSSFAAYTVQVLGYPKDTMLALLNFNNHYKVKNALADIATVLEPMNIIRFSCARVNVYTAKLSVDTFVHYIKQHKALEVNTFSFFKSTSSTPCILTYRGSIFWVRCMRSKSLEKLIIFRE